jgi:hypothetical protein
LEDVELLVLLEIVSKGVACKVDGEKVACWDATWVTLDVPDVEKLGVPTFP